MNSIRDKAKESLTRTFKLYTVTSKTKEKIVKQALDELFEIFNILPLQQNMADGKLIFNPKVRISIRDGLACAYEVTEGINLSIKDYDVSGYCTVEELNEMPENKEGEKYEERS